MSDTETRVQAAVRLEMARRGYRLWRNNSGVLYDERGTPVRYGLGNDSHQLNRKIKSSDLIGWHPLVITPGHVGLTIAQFVSLECKPSGFKLTDGLLTGTGEEAQRIQAQKAWIDLVLGDGGEARFVTGI